MFVGGGSAEGFGHYFCFAEEEPAGCRDGRIVSHVRTAVRLSIGLWSLRGRTVWEVGKEKEKEKEGKGGGRVRESNRPAIAKRRADVLEVGIAHVGHGEDDAVLVLVDAGADQAE